MHSIIARRLNAKLMPLNCEKLCMGTKIDHTIGCSVLGCPFQTPSEKIEYRNAGILGQVCRAHYSRWYRTGDLRPNKPLGKRTRCGFSGCELTVINSRCPTHKSRVPQSALQDMLQKGTHKVIRVTYRQVSWNGYQIPEHIAIMRLSLGDRTLVTRKEVHHINGQHDQNNIENLGLWFSIS